MRKYQGKNTIAEGMRSGTCRSGIRDRWCKDNTTTTNDEEEEEKGKKEEEIEEEKCTVVVRRSQTLQKNSNNNNTLARTIIIHACVRGILFSSSYFFVHSIKCICDTGASWDSKYKYFYCVGQLHL